MPPIDPAWYYGGTWRRRGVPRQFPRTYPSMATRRRQLVAELGNLEYGARRNIASTAMFDFAALVTNVAGSFASVEMQNYFRILAENLNPKGPRTKMPRARILEAYRQVGMKAQRSVRSAYIARRPARDLPAYRTFARNPRNQRYANGALLRAIGAPDFFEVTDRGIKFINEERLTREAKHWRRLNFGTAGGAPVSPPREFQMDWGVLLQGRSSPRLGLAPDVRPAFRIPRGVFVEPGIFYPMSEVAGVRRGTVTGVVGRPGRTGRRAADKRVNSRTFRADTGQMTRGIASTNFLDRGVAAIARNMLPEFELLMREYYGRTLPPAFRQRIRPRTRQIPKGRVRQAYRAGGYGGSPGQVNPF